jgi:Hemerythrin HHE cation binding domain
MSRAIERRRRRQRPKLIDGEVDQAHVRETLMAQHERLRAMLAVLDAKALDLIRGGTCAQTELAGALANAASALDDHMRGEERILAQALPHTASAVRGRTLVREDHDRQREELRAMSRLALRCDDTITLALAVRAFVSDVRLDMDAEDRRFLSEWLRADVPADAAS